MYRIPLLFLLIALLSMPGCAHVGCPGLGPAYPFSCPLCPYYDYQYGMWRPFMFGFYPAVDSPEARQRAAEGARQREEGPQEALPEPAWQ
jgi:hypothetical protein